MLSLCKVHNDQIYEKLKKDEKMKMPEKPKACIAFIYCFCQLNFVL